MSRLVKELIQEGKESLIWDVKRIQNSMKNADNLIKPRCLAKHDSLRMCKWLHIFRKKINLLLDQYLQQAKSKLFGAYFYMSEI